MSSYFHFTLQEFNFQKAHTIELFHEPVESQAIDSVNSRYAAASHSGTIKVFTIDDYSKSLLAVLGHLGNVSPSDSLMPLWQLDIGNLPINTRFYGTKRNLIVHALYTSEMYDWHIPSHSVNEQHLIDYVLMFRTDRSLEQPLYVGRCKCRSRIYYSFAHLSTTSGSATFSPDEGVMAIHNLTSDKVHVYIPATAHMPKYRLNIEAEEGVPKKFAFAEEKGRTLICGSDDGVIYVFDVATGALLHTLEHSQGELTLQMYATTLLINE